MNNVVEIKTIYKVGDFEFDSEDSANEFLNNNIIFYDEHEQDYSIFNKSLVERYELMLINDRELLFSMFREYANSNSMGCLSILNCMNYVFSKNNIDMEDVWSVGE